jgi:hypothetical protein
MYRRQTHGNTVPTSVFKTFSDKLTVFKTSMGMPAAKVGSDFDYMFPGLQTAADRLPPTPDTVLALKQLAKVMTDMPENIPGGGATGPGDSGTPAAYTYFGQFLDHDITFDQGSLGIEALAEPGLVPLESLDGLRNSRTSTADLDSVYAVGPEGRDGDRLVVGRVTPIGGTARPLLKIPGKSELNDLPRQPRSSDKGIDRAAIIGDPRNDENTIVAQMHTAFLKAHNALVATGMTFDAAREALILRYQAVVLNDFLREVCDKTVVKDVLANGPKFWRVKSAKNLFMPVEFSVAAYRFGHSMIRKQYDFNLNFSDRFVSDFGTLFSFTALSGNIGEVAAPAPGEFPHEAGFDTLPENWIIEWERFLPLAATKPQMARLIDPRLTDQMFFLKDTFGQPEGTDFLAGSQAAQLAPKLAMRNLLRGYLFGLPTGQAVARHMKLAPLRGKALIDALPTPELQAAAEPFKDATPLWFYVLAEAGDMNGAKGMHLGEVGSRIVAETLWNLIKHAEISVLDGKKGAGLADFTLSDIIRLAGTQDS